MKLRKYSGYPPWTNGEIQTCSAFITKYEQEMATSFEPMKILSVSEYLNGPALDWWNAQSQSSADWNSLKQEFINKFSVKLTWSQKINVRQSLRQLDDESVNDFLERCTYAQHVITDDSFEDAAFERDVLLNWVLGMKPELQSQVISSNERTLQGFLELAIKIESDTKNLEVNTKDISITSRPKRKRKSLKSKDENFYFDNDDLQDIVLDDFEPVKEESELKNELFEGEPVKTFNEEDQTNCKVCGRAVLDEKRLEVHMLVKHRKDPTKFECGLCFKHLKSEDSLKKHVQFTCLQDRPESCPICQKNFICKKSVKLHVQSVHFKEKPHLCSECGKGFCTPTSLRTHRENVHQKLKKYVCKLCNKAYGNQGNLYVHNQRHHQRYSYMCFTCGKQFCRPFELRRHMTVKHGIGALPHACDQCDKAFFEPKELKNHIAITHEGERPFNCEYCPETFTRKSAQVRHLKRKHPTEFIGTNLWKKGQNVMETSDDLDELSDKVFITPNDATNS